MLTGLKKLIKQRKKGFTLVELLAVIVILAVIMVITIPTILVSLNNSKQKAFENIGQIMKKYLEDNYRNCRLGNKDIAKYDEIIFGDKESCTLKQNIKNDLIINSGYSLADVGVIDITEDGRGNFGLEIFAISKGKFDGCNDYSTGIVPNKPDLSTGLVPIKYDGTNWLVTTSTDPEWFDYDNQKWANAASLAQGVSKEVGTKLRVPDGSSTDSDILAMFVWVPRFSYTIGCLEKEVDSICVGYKIDGASDLDYSDTDNIVPGAIDIKFISKDRIEDKLTSDNIYPEYLYTISTDRTPTNWYTHPAFWWDKNNDGKRLKIDSNGNKIYDEGEELSGIWVGKFEMSGSEDEPKILPNVLSLVNKSVSDGFEIIKKFSESGNNYGINSEKIDAHMMKNSEWGAVSYLSQSIYGKYGNKDYSEKNKEIYKNDSGSTSHLAGYTGKSQGFAPATINNSYLGSYKYDDISTTYGTKNVNMGSGASTTGNIYGIYDMSGGAYEYVMGYYENATSGTSLQWGSTNIENNAGFTAKPENKYFDGYSNGIYENSKETVGHATYETKGWYSDKTENISDSSPWVIRGGYHGGGANTGIFSSIPETGKLYSSISFRSVLVNYEL